MCSGPQTEELLILFIINVTPTGIVSKQGRVGALNSSDSYDIQNFNAFEKREKSIKEQTYEVLF